MILFLLTSSAFKQPIPGYTLYLKYKTFYTQHWGLIFLFTFLAGTTFFIFLKKAVFELDYLRIWKDTTEYVAQTSYHVFSKEFIFGERIFILPLLYKLLNITIENYNNNDYLLRIALLQFWVGVAAWATLSAAISLQFKKHLSRITAFLAIYLLALGLPNSQWEKLILSESLSNSLFVLLLSLILLTPMIEQRKNKWASALFLCVTLLVSIAYTFIRDANAYLLLLAAFFLLAFLLFIKKKASCRKFFLIQSLYFIMSFALVWINSGLSTRWVRPLAHVLEDRKTASSELSNFYFSNGIDLFKKFPTPPVATRTSLSETSEQTSKDLAFMQKAKNLYVKFLILHPKYTLTSPIKDINGIINPYPTDYRYNFIGTPDWVTKLSNLIYPLNAVVYPAGLLFIVLSLVITPNQGRALKLSLLFLLISVFPIGWLIWHADTVEYIRHSEQILIQSRIVFWVSIICFLDSLPIGKSRN
jgi:hypothetical protein